jgi:hypothetical protein
LGARISSISILDHGVAGVLFAACLALISPLVAAESAGKSAARTSIPPNIARATAPAVARSRTDSQNPATDSDAAAVETSAYDYSRYTHHQLTELGARWDDLEDAERRALLREVKMRMARQKDPGQVLQIRTQRRYGRLVRRSDGKVLRIETQVVQVRPVNPRQSAPERSFGVGFERRVAATGPQQQGAGEQNDPERDPQATQPMTAPRTASESP